MPMNCRRICAENNYLCVRREQASRSISYAKPHAGLQVSQREQSAPHRGIRLTALKAQPRQSGQNEHTSAQPFTSGRCCHGLKNKKLQTKVRQYAIVCHLPPFTQYRRPDIYRIFSFLIRKSGKPLRNHTVSY